MICFDLAIWPRDGHRKWWINVVYWTSLGSRYLGDSFSICEDSLTCLMEFLIPMILSCIISHVMINGFQGIGFIFIAD